jgi:hypothetical protein
MKGLTSAVGLTLLGTTCCALPITLVAIGAGGAVASMASSAPWLIELSRYKLATFSLTAAALGYAWWSLRSLSRSQDGEACSIEDARKLRWQKRILVASTTLFGLSVFAAYGLPTLFG